MNRSLVVTALLTLVIGIGLGTLYPFGDMLSRFQMGSTSENVRAESDAQVPMKILYWVAPMDPSYRRDKPGKSPMGMDLVPVYEGEEDAKSDSSSVRINPTVINNIGVRTAMVERRAAKSQIHTVGRIMYDEDRIAYIHPRADGWIERLAVRAVGARVKKGDLLFTLYSPALVNAQAEFLQVLRRNKTNVVEASRERLRALAISEDQIKALEKSRTPLQYVKFYAPIDGVVTKLGAADGMYVKLDVAVMILADVSTVWLMSDVFESDAELLRIGSHVEATSKFNPGMKISGKVDYVYPDVNRDTRTIPVRTVLSNVDGQFKPGMFMTVSIEGPNREDVILIPREALIRTGLQERVIVANGDGHFQPALVTSGREFVDKIEILSGLAPNEQVVVSGQFLIDSESSFAGAKLRLTPPRQKSMEQGPKE